MKLTANFEGNLAALKAFLIEAAAAHAYDALLDDLLQTAIPSLERYPRIGKPFLAREPRSIESRAAVERLRARLGRGEIREIVVGDHVILYAFIGGTVYLLSIRHHRQLSFDFKGFWSK